jgi:hypothetical protein
MSLISLRMFPTKMHFSSITAFARYDRKKNLQCKGSALEINGKISFSCMSTIRSKVLWIPIINFFFEVFFDEPPNREQLQKMLEIIALVDALLISVVCSIPGNVTFDEIQSAMQRFNNVGDTSWSFCTSDTKNEVQYYKEFCQRIQDFNGYANASVARGHDSGHPFSMIYGLSQYTIASISFFFISILMTIFVFLATIKVHHREDLHLSKRWWRFVAPVCFMIFTSMVAGLVTFFFAMHRLIFIKFPSYWLEMNGKPAEWSMPTWTGDPPHNYSIWAYFAICGSLAVALLFISAATFANRSPDQILPVTLAHEKTEDLAD